MKFSADLAAAHTRDILAALAPFEPEVTLVGTMFINGEGNDYDYVVYEPEDRPAGPMIEDLMGHGFTRTSPESYNDSQFLTMRKGDVNLMLTRDPEFHKGFVAAARVCKYMQDGGFVELNREQRVKIHRIIMNGEEP